MLLKILILNFTIFILIVPENFDNCIDTEDETLSKNLFFSLCYRLGVELQTFQQKKVFKIGQNLHELSTFPAFVECRFLRGLGRRDCWDVTNVCYFYGFCRSYIRLKPKKRKWKKCISHSFHILWNEFVSHLFQMAHLTTLWEIFKILLHICKVQAKSYRDVQKNHKK